MKRGTLLILGLVGALSCGSLAFAFGGEEAFYQFLSDHPQIRQDLEANPNVVNEPGYLRDHPAFREFFRDHDEVRRELAHNAPEIMRREEIDNEQRTHRR